jgi:hypothetical protein
MLPLVPLALVAALLTGCVPATEPLCDPDKAEPDEGLLGVWRLNDNVTFEIDSPAVKGNPKGLMRAAGESKDAFWFFTTKIGKNTYGTICLAGDGYADFRKEGAFEEWKKGDRRYFIFRYELDGDKLTVDSGNDEAMKKLMQAEKVESAGRYFKTPPGWLAKYLEKSGPETLYDGKYQQKYLRQKK